MVETYIREDSKLIHLVINGEEIITTETHPFYVNMRGFVNAGELKIGDELLDSSGNILFVEKFDVELTEKPTKVYNFQVEDFHTYHVGSLGVLVHNADYPKSPGDYEKAPYHNKGNDVKSAAPVDGQATLDKSISIKPTTTRRVSVEGDHFVVFDETTPGVFHGHIRSWNDLTPSMKSALIKAGLTNNRGKVL